MSSYSWQQGIEGYSSSCLCLRARKGQHSQNELLAVGSGLDNYLAELLLRTGPSTSWQHSHLGQSRHCSLCSTGSCRQLQVRSSCTAKITSCHAICGREPWCMPSAWYLLLAVVWCVAAIQQMAALKRWSLLEARAATRTQQIKFG